MTNRIYLDDGTFKSSKNLTFHYVSPNPAFFCYKNVKMKDQVTIQMVEFLFQLNLAKTHKAVKISLIPAI